jgi:hypothetical protein
MKTAAQLVACLLAIGFGIQSFLLLKRKDDVASTKLALYSFGALAAALLIGDGGSFFATMPAIEQIICWLFALWYLRLAFDLAKVKDGLGYAFVVLIISAFSFFCGMSGVQAFLKTHMLMTVKDSFISYGEKLDRFQTNVIEMRNDLSDQQALLNSNQTVLTSNLINMKKDISYRQNALGQNLTNFQEMVNQQGDTLAKIVAQLQSAESNVSIQQLNITNQFKKMSIVQTNLDIAQSNLDAQAKQITDVEYWVKNLYAKTTTDKFTIADTNNLMIIQSSNRITRIVARLTHVPIYGSVEEQVTGPFGIQQTFYELNFIENITSVVFSGFDTNSAVIFHYVMDDRATNSWRHMPKLNEEILFDSDYIWRLATTPR